MKSKFVPLFISVGLVAASGAAGAWLGSKLFQPSEYTHQGFHDRLFSELRLTPVQRAQMNTLEDRHAAEIEPLQETLLRANRILADRLSQETSYTDEVDLAVESVHAAMLELQKTSVRHLYEMRNILDDRQKEAFDRHVAETMEKYANQPVD